jgi:hypothetical protein
MEHDNKLKWDGFLASLTWADCLKEFLETLNHLERYRDAFPAPECPAPFAHALEQMRTMGTRLESIIHDPGCYEQKATPEIANVILALARRVKREVPTVAHSGCA